MTENGRPAYPLPGEIGEVLFTETEIEARVTELGERIAGDFADRTPLLIGVLKGSAIFVADLVRAVTGPVEVDFLAVSSYGQATKSSGVVKILKDLDSDIEGRSVVLVEDIIDSGLTMQFLVEHLTTRRPADLRTCSLLVRESATVDGFELDYVGFRIPPAFVVGYGLDVAQRYRNLPYIATYTGPGSGHGPEDALHDC
ncbi:MAG: hypoxanthine phosphoribosyltransferase [Actinomycetota bacterium]